MLLKLVGLAAIIACVSTIRVCEKYEDYYSFHGNCSWSKNAKDMPELVTQYGYNLDTHNVTTEDKYILTVFRLKRDNPVGVVLLMHYALGTSACWVDQQNASLAYTLYHAGYDVWMGNFRGNFYSRAHETLDPNSRKFWNFTYEEMGMYDLPAIITTVKTTTGAAKISYVGISMGGTAASIYASKLPQQAARDINLFIFLAPGCFFANTTSFTYLVLGPSFKEIYEVAYAFNYLELLPHSPPIIDILTVCRSMPGLPICTTLIQHLIFGVNETNINPAYMPIFWYQFPGGLGMKVQGHYEQAVKYKRFAEYDYGKKENNRVYGADIPPLYPLENIIPPVHLYVGSRDAIISVSGVEYYKSRLKNDPALNKLKVIEGYAHLDFLWALGHEEKVNEPIRQAIDNVHGV